MITFVLFAILVGGCAASNKGTPPPTNRPAPVPFVSQDQGPDQDAVQLPPMAQESDCGRCKAKPSVLPKVGISPDHMQHIPEAKLVD
ncbi:MAG: hypothetical protein ABII13_00590 [Patescibacteria group bacterium]|nr:hypothetical protein [Patescibacteria group bacterium]